MSDLLLPKQLYHKQVAISQILLRFQDTFIDGYGKYFFEKLHENNDEVKKIQKTVNTINLEVKQQNASLLESQQEQAEVNLKIKITAPVSHKEKGCL